MARGHGSLVMVVTLSYDVVAYQLVHGSIYRIARHTHSSGMYWNTVVKWIGNAR